MKTILYIIIILLVITFIFLTVEQYCRYHDKSLLEILHPEWFENPTKFPTNDPRFTCSKNCNNYWSKVSDGYNIMATKRLIIAGLCINIEKKIPFLKQKIEHLGGFFREYKCVIFENDSKDNTRPLLKQLTKQNNNIILIDCPDAVDCKYGVIGATQHGLISEKRMEKMSKYRNKLLEHIKENYFDYDCVMFLDLDLRGPIDINGVANSFGYYNNWDSISAFGLSGVSFTTGHPIYYDTLAYNDGKYNVYNSTLDALKIIIAMNNKEIGDEPIKVLSGFGGMALYKMKIFNDPNKIDYTPMDGKYVCEHYILHNNMIRNGFDKIFVNPNMVLLSGPQGNVEKYPFY